MLNHYFDLKHPLRPYTHTAPANPGSMRPDNALRVALPFEFTGDGRAVKQNVSPEYQNLWPGEIKGAWVLIEDHRGEKGWLDGQETEIKDFGPLPLGWSAETPEPAPEEMEALELESDKAEAAEILTKRLLKSLALEGEFSPDEFSVLARAGYFESYDPQREYAEGERYIYEGEVYEAGASGLVLSPDSPNRILSGGTIGGKKNVA